MFPIIQTIEHRTLSLMISGFWECAPATQRWKSLGSRPKSSRVSVVFRKRIGWNSTNLPSVLIWCNSFPPNVAVDVKIFKLRELMDKISKHSCILLYYSRNTLILIPFLSHFILSDDQLKMHMKAHKPFLKIFAEECVARMQTSLVRSHVETSPPDESQVRINELIWI